MIATKIAMEYQRKFAKDVFVEIHCFRKWGHNELDDPSMTNPLLYQKVNSKHTVPDTYLENLKNENIMSNEESSKVILDHSAMLNDHFKQIESYTPKRQNLKKQWQMMKQPGESLTEWDTGLPLDLLR